MIRDYLRLFYNHAHIFEQAYSQAMSLAAQAAAGMGSGGDGGQVKREASVELKHWLMSLDQQNTLTLEKLSPWTTLWPQWGDEVPNPLPTPFESSIGRFTDSCTHCSFSQKPSSSPLQRVKRT